MYSVNFMNNGYPYTTPITYIFLINFKGVIRQYLSRIYCLYRTVQKAPHNDYTSPIYNSTEVPHNNYIKLYNSTEGVTLCTKCSKLISSGARPLTGSCHPIWCDSS